MERFFISGCQRSGTTMLRLILESHPSIECLDEAGGYDILVNQPSMDLRALASRDETEFIGFKIPRFAEQLLWEQLSDPDYGSFPSFYKDEKVIHILRDPLDVVGSMMRLKTAEGRSWLERYGLSILKELIKNPNIDHLYKQKYDELEHRGLPLHLVGALYWEIKNHGLFVLQKYGKPAHLVRYETLVESPKTQLADLCQFLGVNWDERLLSHPSQPHSELDDKGFAIGETDPRRSIDTQSVGTYKHLLRQEWIVDINAFVEKTWKRLTGADT